MNEPTTARFVRHSIATADFPNEITGLFRWCAERDHPDLLSDAVVDPNIVEIEVYGTLSTAQPTGWAKATFKSTF